MGFFAALVIYLPTNRKTESQPWIYESNIADASVKNEIFQDPSAQIDQLHGVKVVDRTTGKFTYYFEYIANKQDTLRRIAALPFLKDNRPSSLSVELMESALNPLDGSILSQEEREATSFFWEAQAEEFIFYECYKSPVKHTLLISKTSNHILHKVELV
jgi:hypothetical protein